MGLPCRAAVLILFVFQSTHPVRGGTAQYVSFLITRQEQTVLIEWYFRAVVIECGAMMMKRLAEVIVGRIKKKEKIDITESEDTNNDY